MEQVTNLNSRSQRAVSTAESDPFVALPRNCDTAVVYWNVEEQVESSRENPSTRLCIQVSAKDSNAEEYIFLHRNSGHFIVPLLADDRHYEVNLGWSDASGFRAISSQSVQLPHHPNEETPGALSSSLSYRGAHFWPKSCDPSVN